MSDERLRRLGELFSDYRAEWSADLFGDLFIAPPYFPKLEAARPCFLIGGRGTGKTTSLRSLRFDASLARLTSDSVPAEKLPYYGVYIRINKNRVRAFQGPQLTEEQWDKAFAHYFNILCCSELCRLVAWLEHTQSLAAPDLSLVSRAFGADSISGHAALLDHLNGSLVSLELYVNNPAQAKAPLFSVAEAPLRFFVDALRAVESLAGRLFFLCIDEYENLLDSQQGVINTFVKHAEPPLSYKIGVRRNGLRNRATIDRQDVLATPDDYLEIDIAQEGFEPFARQVVEHRLTRARAQGLDAPETLEEFLPELPLGVEAELLGCDRVADLVLKEVASKGDAALFAWLTSLPKNQVYFLSYWSEGSGQALDVLARDWQSDPETWATRLGNYGYASLFWLSKGRKGARIRKYYAGARTFLGLASGNIRYFIELIDESIGSVAGDEALTAKWKGAIPPERQTLAARTVGKRRLEQLEGLSEHGSEIKRLVLALGKVFFEFARDPVGKSPERNSFVLIGEPEARAKALALLLEGVSTLAFEVTPRTKATTQREMRDDEFRLHPIFAPFFEYSHRRKRRCTFPAETLLEVLRNPAHALAELIGHAPVDADELPQQLAMFSSFYDAGERRQ